MLTVNDLHVSYGRQQVLRGVDISLQPAQIHGLMGVNGAGKTTLLNTLYGLVSAQQGEMQWNGLPLTSKSIAFLESEPSYYPRITGREHLEIFRLQNPAFPVEAWERAISLPLDKFIDQYSTGMKKKLSLLSVICLDRPIMVLDEPFNGLDLETNHLLYSLLRRLADSGKTIIVTSHILESLLRLADDIHVLSEGRILKAYSPSEYGNIEDDVLRTMTEERLEGLI